MTNSDIIKIGFEYRASLAQFEKETNGAFNGITKKIGKQKIVIQLDAKDDKIIEKIKELQKLKPDNFTFEFRNSGAKEQLKTFTQLENKIIEIINLSKGIKGNSPSIINVKDSTAQIDKLQNKLKELDKRLNNLSKKQISISVSGNDIDLINNEEFTKISIEVETLKTVLKDLSNTFGSLRDETVNAESLVKLSENVTLITDKIEKLDSVIKTLDIAKQANDSKEVNSVIKEYNTLTDTTFRTKLAETMSAASYSNIEYVTGLKDAISNLNSYGSSLVGAKVKTIALTAATTLMNSALSMGISYLVTTGISALSSWIDSLIVTEEEIKEAAEEAKSAIDEIKSNFDSLRSSTDNIKNRFAELAQGVDNLGKLNQSRGKLSTEDYNEFLDLSNQLSELFPQLTKGYDNNGNAILNLTGNINTIVSSIENLVSAQQQLANQQILQKMPAVWSGYMLAVKKYKENLKEPEWEAKKYKEALEVFSKKYDNGEKILYVDGDPANKEQFENSFYNEPFITALKRLNIDYDEIFSSDEEGIYWDFSKFNDDQAEQFKDALKSLVSESENSIQQMQDKMAYAKSQMSSYINTWLSTDLDAQYQLAQMSPDMQNVVKDVLFDSTNWIDSIPNDVDATKWSEVSKWLTNNLLNAVSQINDSEIQTALVNALNGNFTVDSLQEIIKQLLSTKGFSENDALIIYLETKIKNKNEKIDAVKARLNNDLSEDELDDRINNLSEEDLGIAAEISVSEDSILSWDELIEKIEEFKKNSISSFEDAFNATSFADSKEKLLELAKSGEITADALESTSKYNTLLNKTQLSAEKAKQKILGMLSATEKLSAASNGLDSLSTAFDEWKNKGFVTAETLDALPDVFKENKEKFDLFSQIVGDPNRSSEVQQAFNDIATEYLKTQGTLDKITKENTSSYIANLKNMGISNAEEVVAEYTTAKNEFDTLLSEAYDEWMSHLNDDDQALESYLLATDTKNAKLMNAFGEEYSTDYQNWIDLLQKKKDTYEAYTSAIESSNEDPVLALAQKVMSVGLYVEYENLDKELQELAEEYSAKLASANTSDSFIFTGNKDSSSSSSKDSSQTYDWIETKINRLNDALDSVKTKADNTYSSWTKRNTELADAISKTKAAIDLQSQAYTRYMQKADSVGLPEEYKQLVQSGSIDFNTPISDETIKTQISEYQTWYEKAQECLKTQDDLNAELNELDTQKFDNIKSEYDDVINRMQSAYNLLESQITLLSSSGDYDTLRNKQTDIVNKLQSERNALQNNLNSSDIQQYTTAWYNLVSQIDDLDSQILEAENELKDIDNLQFDNIKEAFDFDTSVLEHGLQTIQNKIDLLELKGQFANESYYNGMIEYTQRQLDTLKNERSQLQSILNNTLYKQGTSEWNNMYSTLMDIDEEIDSMTNNLVDFNNAIRDLNWEIFEYLEESLSRITEETDYYVELLSKKDLFDENGQITNYGTTSIALHAAAYDVYKQQAQDYYEEVQDLQKQLVNGAGRDVLEQYNDMVEAHRNAVLAAEDEKQSILDLIEDGYNAQLDALQKLIDKKKEQLNAEKNLYDYQKSIAEKTDNISSLEKQKLAYEGDTSEEAMSKIQQIKVQLEEAKADLKESEYEQYLSDTETMLDQLSEDYQEWMNERLDNSDKLMSQIIGEVSSEVSLVNDTLKNISEEFGTFTSESLDTIFSSDNPFTQSLTSGLSNVSNSLNSGLGGVSTSIAGTTTAIDNLIGKIAGITGTSADNTNAGTNAANNNKADDKSSNASTNGSVNNKPSSYNPSNDNSNKPTSNNSTPDSVPSASDDTKTGKSPLDNILISKKDYYPKGSLNIETSVVDRLKYKDKDSSFSARAMYWNKIFGGAYTGSSSQNTKLLNYLKSNGYKSGTSNAAKGYHWTQEDGEELIYRTSDGAVLTPLGQGDMVFDNESSKRLWELANNPEGFMQKYNIAPSIISAMLPQHVFNSSLPDFDTYGEAHSSQNMSIGDINVNMELPNVTDYKDFRNQLISDSTFEKAMFTSINHALTGKGTSLDKLKHAR